MRFVLPLAGSSMNASTLKRCDRAIERARIVSRYADVTILLCGGRCARIAGSPILALQMREYISKQLPDIPILCNESEAKVLDLYGQISCAWNLLSPLNPKPRVDFVTHRSDIHRVRDILANFPDIHPGSICPISGKSRPYKERSWSISELFFPHYRFLNRA